MFGRATLAAVFAAATALCVVVFIAALGADEVSSAPKLPVIEPIVIDETVSAEAFMVFDVVTGLPIAEHNVTEELPIASITKLFTAAVVLESEKLEATTTITWSDVAAEGRAGKLEAYEVYSQRELLWPLLLESSNDAAAVLERVDPDVIEKMNELVVANNASKTRFADASGLSDKNISTADELASLARNLYLQHPHLFDVTQLPQYVGTQTGWVNNSPFIDEDDYRGGKHGFTYEANRTAVALFEEEIASGGTRLIGYVLLGSEDLDEDIALLRP